MPLAIRQILVPTDLSAAAERALEHARLLAERFQAALTLYHSVEVPDPRFAHWAFAHAHEVWTRAEEEARKILTERSLALAVPARVIVEKTCSTHTAIVEMIRKLQPDITVMATHGREGLAHLLLGSVTEKVIQRVYRPVLCLREPEHGVRFPYRRILVPTDLSLGSRLAFPLAARFARSLGAAVIGVHATPSPSMAVLSGIPGPGPVVIPSEAHLWKFLQEDFGGLSVTAQILTGPVWERIVQVARVERIDLIVMATRGHDSLGDHILGSNTERVVRHAPCPVMVA